MARIHFIGAIGTTGDIAVCGEWQPANMTGERTKVTCWRCRRTREFEFARIHPETRTPALIAYRRGLVPSTISVREDRTT